MSSIYLEFTGDCSITACDVHEVKAACVCYPLHNIGSTHVREIDAINTEDYCIHFHMFKEQKLSLFLVLIVY